MEQWYATGRRKCATARVYLRPGTGGMTINGRQADDFFPLASWRNIFLEPLQLTDATRKFDILVNVAGGGKTGQAGAIRHGISRALQVFDPELRAALKKAGFLCRDARIKERKKYGQRGARARFQFSKR